MQRSGFFMNFFLHEVFITPLFSRLYIPGDFFDRFFNGLEILIKKLYLAFCKLSNITVIQMIDITCIGKYGWNVGSDKISVFAQPDNQRGSMTYRDKAVGEIAAENSERIRTL